MQGFPSRGCSPSQASLPVPAHPSMLRVSPTCSPACPPACPFSPPPAADDFFAKQLPHNVTWLLTLLFALEQKGAPHAAPASPPHASASCTAPRRSRGILASLPPTRCRVLPGCRGRLPSQPAHPDPHTHTHTHAHGLPPAGDFGDTAVQGALVHQLRYLASVVTQNFSAFGELLAMPKRFAEISGGRRRPRPRRPADVACLRAELPLPLPGACCLHASPRLTTTTTQPQTHTHTSCSRRRHHSCERGAGGD